MEFFTLAKIGDTFSSAAKKVDTGGVEDSLKKIDDLNVSKLDDITKKLDNQLGKLDDIENPNLRATVNAGSETSRRLFSSLQNNISKTKQALQSAKNSVSELSDMAKTAAGKVSFKSASDLTNERVKLLAKKNDALRALDGARNDAAKVQQLARRLDAQAELLETATKTTKGLNNVVREVGDVKLPTVSSIKTSKIKQTLKNTMSKAGDTFEDIWKTVKANPKLTAAIIGGASMAGWLISVANAVNKINNQTYNIKSVAYNSLDNTKLDIEYTPADTFLKTGVIQIEDSDSFPSADGMYLGSDGQIIEVAPGYVQLRTLHQDLKAWSSLVDGTNGTLKCIVTVKDMVSESIVDVTKTTTTTATKAATGIASTLASTLLSNVFGSFEWWWWVIIVCVILLSSSSALAVLYFTL